MANPIDIIRGSAKDALQMLAAPMRDLRQGFSLFQTFQIGVPLPHRFNYRSYAEDGYRKSELVYACIREIATSVSEAPYRVIVNEGGVKVPVVDHPAWELLADPNDVMSGFEFWEAELVVEHIAGNCYVWKERNDRGRPIKLWILRPDWVRFKPAQPIRNSVYQYSPGGSFDDIHTITISMVDMIHFKHGPDPLGLYNEGLSPIRVALRNTALDNDATDFFSTIFTNAGIPSGIIKVKKRLQSQREANRIMKRWTERYSGVRGWNRPAVMDEDAEYEKIGMDFREMMADAIRDVPETRICMVFGVPPIIVGANIGLKRSTYTNYGAAKSSFWEETLSPKFRQLAERVDKSLINIDFPSDVRVESEFDTSNVRALREDVSARWRRATQAFNVGGITINMFLQEIGKEAIEGGDVFLIPGNRVEKAAPATSRMLLETLGEVRYRQLFKVSGDHLQLEAAREMVTIDGDNN